MSWFWVGLLIGVLIVVLAWIISGLDFPKQ